MRAMSIRSDCGTFPAVVGDKGRIWTKFVRMESPTTGPFIKQYKMANGDVELFAKPLLKGIDPYPMKRICNHMLRIGRKHGITKSAKKLLQEAKREG